MAGLAAQRGKQNKDLMDWRTAGQEQRLGLVAQRDEGNKDSNLLAHSGPGHTLSLYNVVVVLYVYISMKKGRRKSYL